MNGIIPARPTPAQTQNSVGHTETATVLLFPAWFVRKSEINPQIRLHLLLKHAMMVRTKSSLRTPAEQLHMHRAGIFCV